MKSNIIIINKKDNVGIALEDINSGSTVVTGFGESFNSLNDVPYSHKIALFDIGEGEKIMKYGEVIGQASMAIKKGEWIHTHNIGINEH
jgi:altronate dehydratase